MKIKGALGATGLQGPGIWTLSTRTGWAVADVCTGEVWWDLHSTHLSLEQGGVEGGWTGSTEAGGEDTSQVAAVTAQERDCEALPEVSSGQTAWLHMLTFR